MMKRLWKGLLGLIAAMAMLLTGGVLAGTANAAEATTGSITVSNAKKGQEYKAYKIFDVASYVAGDETNPAKVSYTLATDSPWRNFFTGKDATGAKYVTVADNGVVTAKENFSDAAAFAKDALAYIAQNPTVKFGETKKTATFTGETTEGNLTFDNLGLGYYLVTSTVGSLVSIDTTTPSATITDKNETPTVDKQVQEDSQISNANQGWGASNDAQIGETVNFKTTITAQAGATNYVLHDQLSQGLTFGSVSKITLDYADQTATDKTLNTPADYSVLTGESVQTYNPTGKEGVTEKDSFTVTFAKSLLDSLKAGDKLVVEYTATVNEDAVIRGDGNPNKTYLDYGEGNHASHTPESTTTTYVWDFNVFKYTGTDTPLSGATFKLTTDESGNNAVQFVKKGDNKYRVAKTDDKTTVTEFTTDSTGKFNLSGLDSGTYWLHETQAPAGYNKLTKAIKVVIDDQGNVKIDNSTTAATDNTVKVENNAGSELPSTGGMGTTILYTVGVAVVVIAAAGLAVVLSKRRTAR